MICLTCLDCDYKTTVPNVVYKNRKLAGLPIEEKCRSCGGHTVLSKPAATRKSDSQKRSQRQEKRAAQRIGGNVQPASGAGSSKGDVRLAFDTRMECKLTRAMSYGLKLKDLEKIEREASAGEKPVFEIEFQGVYPHKRYVVLPGWLYDQMTGE